METYLLVKNMLLVSLLVMKTFRAKPLLKADSIKWKAALIIIKKL